jgi:hypothetical protein
MIEMAPRWTLPDACDGAQSRAKDKGEVIFGGTYNLTIFVVKPTNKELTKRSMLVQGERGGITTGILQYISDDKTTRYQRYAPSR